MTTPYRNQPKYTSGEKREMSEKRKESERRLDNLKGRSGNCNWCLCNECESMPTDTESLCCHESETISSVRRSLQCITLHESFGHYVLSIEGLNIARHSFILHSKDSEVRAKFRDTSNKMYRHVAYKQFVYWINSWVTLGKNNRIVIPSCVIKSIREEYPEADGIYTGYKQAPEHDADYFY
jgi:hypothetical protein